MRLMLRFLGFLFAAGTIMFVVGVGAAAGLLWHFSKDLPDYSQLQDYEPPVMTRVHAADGSLVAEYARERRLYIPIQAVPKLVINAFLAAEDRNFYQHGGLDFTGIARAALSYVQNYGSGRRPQGASTITQQVAKNFLLTNEVSLTRKIKEALLALKIERTYSKDKILELYLNEIYLGLGAYGIAAASLTYFDKSVNELTIQEAAYLATLPKAPNNYNPFRQRERALERRNWVIDRMAEAGFIKAADADKAKQHAARRHHQGLDRPARLRRRIFRRGGAPRTVREVRREEALRGRPVGAHHARSEVSGARAQDAAGRARAFRRGARLARRRSPRSISRGDWGVKLAGVKSLDDVEPWRLAVVLEVSDHSARIGLQPGRDPGGAVSKERAVGILPLEGVKWAKVKGRVPAKVGQVRRARRRRLRLADGEGRRPVPAAADPGSVRRHGGRGPADRPRARHGRRLLLRPEPVQPRHAGAAPARLLVQADRLFRRARQRLYAVVAGARRAARDRPGPRPRRVEAGELRGRLLRPLDACASASSIRATS